MAYVVNMFVLCLISIMGLQNSPVAQLNNTAYDNSSLVQMNDTASDNSSLVQMNDTASDNSSLVQMNDTASDNNSLNQMITFDNVTNNFTQNDTGKAWWGLFGPDFPPYLNTIRGLVMTCCIGLSCLCMFLRLFIQACVPVYRKSYGWQQFSLVGAMFIGQGGYLAGKYLGDYYWPCFGVGLASHWGFLISFLWMNVIAIDTWRAFSYSFFGQMNEVTAYAMYAFYATIIPSFIVGIPLVFYFDKDLSWSSRFDAYKPNYMACGVDLTKPYFLMVFMAAPLAVVLLLNFFIYIYARHKLNSSLKHNVTAQEKGRERGMATFSVLLVFKIVTWGMAIVHGFYPLEFLEYIFMGFLTIQGLFVFAALVLTVRCRRKKTSQQSGNEFAGSQASLVSTNNHSISQNPMGQKGEFQMVSISSLNSLAHSQSKFKGTH